MTSTSRSRRIIVNADDHVVNLKAYLGHGPPRDRLLSEPALLASPPVAGAQVVLELLTHPGYLDGELETVSSLGARRQSELALLRSASMAKVLEDDLGFAIVDDRCLSS